MPKARSGMSCTSCAIAPVDVLFRKARCDVPHRVRFCGGVVEAVRGTGRRMLSMVRMERGWRIIVRIYGVGCEMCSR